MWVFTVKFYSTLTRHPKFLHNLNRLSEKGSVNTNSSTARQREKRTPIPGGDWKKKPQKPYLNCNHSKQRKWRLAQLPVSPADGRTDKWKYPQLRDDAQYHQKCEEYPFHSPPTRIVIHVAGGVFFFGIFVNSVFTAHMMRWPRGIAVGI